MLYMEHRGHNTQQNLRPKRTLLVHKKNRNRQMINFLAQRIVNIAGEQLKTNCKRRTEKITLSIFFIFLLVISHFRLFLKLYSFSSNVQLF